MIFVMFCIQYASIKSGVIAIVANLYPVMLLLGFMTLAHFPIDPISMAAVIIVLSAGVDDTIHFFTKFAMFSRQYDSINGAVAATLNYELVPVVATSLAVFLAMMVLTFASLKLSSTLGLLIAVGVLFAFVSDMFINPVLLSKYRIISLLDIAAFKYNADVIRSAPIFDGMSKSEIKKSVLLSRIKHINKGDQIIKQGAVEKSMYLILEGDVEVRKDSKVIAELHPGNIVGEMAYFSNEKRTADVFAKNDCSVVCFDDKGLSHSMKFHKKLYMKMNRNAIAIIIKRLS